MSDIIKTESRIPTGLNEDNIGRVVKVQIFRRTSDDTIDTDSLQKHVGTLEGFSFDRKQLDIKLKGLNIIMASRIKNLVEVYI